ncbi:hypothetical protein MKZ38_008067 [Zalerion maritima]|uniref:Uncharacterized protein n=1 Tax=Zalerion maritima TaxID=339359 RepID=A0AAD5RIC7_9PEZI|nr:hypothetical protein MKZ38_008067 [Zalerion maritima]
MEESEWKCFHQFTVRLGWNTLTGVGPANDCEHHHVLRLNICRSRTDRIIVRFLRWLPSPLQCAIRKFWPGYFLPGNIVLKKLKPQWDVEFDNEIAMYQRLRPLQGRVIPVYYGEARCEGVRAIILQDIHGVPPFGQQKPYITADEFRRKLEVAYQELCTFGVITDDDKLANTILVDDKVMLVDLEMACDADVNNRDSWRGFTIQGLVRQYKEFLS